MYTTIILQGRREHMEDRACVIQNFYRDYALYVLFDGHGGDVVSDTCARKVGGLLKANLESGMPIVGALRKTLTDLDALFSDEECYMTGSTCVLVMKCPDHLWVANCGDSRAIINAHDTGRGYEPLSVDHKPVGKERERIEALGGSVYDHSGVARVNGELAVSRAIGDRRYRPYVVPHPDVYRYKLGAGNKFIVLATDGLWDIMSSQDVNGFVNAFYANAGSAIADSRLLENATNALRTYIQPVIEDNTSVIIVHVRR